MDEINMSEPDLQVLNEGDFVSTSAANNPNPSIDSQELSNKRLKKELTSDVWKFFKKIGKGSDGVERAACNGCKKEYKVGVKPGPKLGNYGTSHLHRHISACKVTSFFDVGQMILDQEGKVRSKKIDQMVHREMLAEAVIKHDLAFCFVEYDKIRAWVNYLNPNAVMPSRNTLVSDINRVQEREREKIKTSLTSIPNRVCLTSDCWTAVNSEGYMCLTAHFVNENWRLCSKILNFCRMPSHTGAELATAIYDCLKQWGIDKKVFSITLDNASANDVLVRILKGHLSLQDSLLCDGEFFHVRCCAHILNLIVQDGLKVASQSLKNIRDSIKYVKSSEGRMKKFQECVQQLGILEGTGLRMDVSTRWNSTYMMLESAMKYEKAFASLHLVDRNYNCCPTAHDWRRAEKMCEFLEPFYDTTNLMSGSSYPTSNLYFMQVWKIECMLNDNLNCEDVVIREMTKEMKEKFDKYWSEYSIVLAFGAVLDPRMKLQFLKFCYKKIDANSAQEKLDLVRNNMYKLFQHYASKSKIQSPSNLQRASEGSKSKESKLLNEFKLFECENSSNEGKSELDLYLEEPKIEFEHFDGLDVLNFWKDNAKRYPDLSIMARDVFSIPITTVASEAAFSIGGRVLTKYRSSILPDNVQTLIRTRNWLHDFDQNPTDEDQAIESCLTSTFSKEGSNVVDVDEG